MGVCLALAANLRNVSGWGWAAVVGVLGYAIGAIWLLVAIRDLRGRSLLSKLVVALLAIAIGAPIVLILLALTSTGAGDAAVWLGLVLILFVLPFVLEDIVPAPPPSPSDSWRAVAGIYVPPGVLLVAAPVMIISSDSFLVFAGFPLFAMASVWWLMRASRPTQPRWWRTALIWAPSLPPLAELAREVWALRTNDVALEGVGLVLPALLVTLAGGVLATWRLGSETPDRP